MGIPEILYYIGLSAKRAYWLRHPKRLPCRVISIGNITVGGTGKTPATIALAEEAKRRGFKPIVLTRGYRGSAKGPCFVTKGENPLLNVSEAGDEPLLMAEKLKDVPIVKGGDRYDAGMFALRELGCTSPGLQNARIFAGGEMSSERLFILDDGFQHWKLYRDKDVLLIDSGDPFGNRSLLPLGKLREPLGALQRADIIVLTKSASPDRSGGKDAGTVIAEIKKYNAKSPVFPAGHSMVTVSLASGERISAVCLKDTKIFGFCALGAPRSFRATVAATGAVISGFRTFRDHHRYSATDIAAISGEAKKTGADWIITTEKDMIKIRGLDLPEKILIIGIEFSIDKEFYDTVFAF